MLLAIAFVILMALVIPVIFYGGILVALAWLVLHWKVLLAVVVMAPFVGMLAGFFLNSGRGGKY